MVIYYIINKCELQKEFIGDFVMSKKDVKLSQNVKKKKKKNKRPITKFLTIFMFIALGAFIFQMIRLNLLPIKLIILVSLVFVLLALILVI